MSTLKLVIIGIADALGFSAAAVLASSDPAPWYAAVVVAPLVAVQVWAWKEMVREMKTVAHRLTQIEMKVEGK